MLSVASMIGDRKNFPKTATKYFGQFNNAQLSYVSDRLIVFHHNGVEHIIRIVRNEDTDVVALWHHGDNMRFDAELSEGDLLLNLNTTSLSPGQVYSGTCSAYYISLLSSSIEDDLVFIKKQNEQDLFNSTLVYR